MLPPISRTPVPAPPRSITKSRTTALSHGIQGAGFPGDKLLVSEASAVAVGETTQVNLNAAALQTLSMAQAAGAEHRESLRTYRGQLFNHIADSMILDGVRSADVSYLADTRVRRSGAERHGACRSGKVRPQPPAAVDPRRGHANLSAEASLFASHGDAHPSSRAKAVATADHLRRALLELPSQATVRIRCATVASRQAHC